MAKVRVTAPDLECAAKQAWDAMFERDRLKSWDLTLIAQPEAIEAHKKLVRAILENNCDLERAIPAATDGKFKYGYGGKGTIGYHIRLGAWLKGWASKRGL
jgi:hypothetical protein